MKLRQALKESGWEAFQNNQEEYWNVSDLLNDFPEGESGWLDSECQAVGDDYIIDIDGDKSTPISE